jgi:arsenate reductase
MSKVTLYHNPRCSKSRQTLQLLTEHGVEPEIVEYLKTPPDARQLERILLTLGLEPRQLMRTNEAEYKDNGLDDSRLTREQLIQAMVDHPKLIQRPIVLKGERAALGRPPENVLEII